MGLTVLMYLLYGKTYIDKSSGGKFEAEFEDASKKLFDYHECLGIEVEERKNLMSMLEQCKRYQEEKNKELKSLRKVG